MGNQATCTNVAASGKELQDTIAQMKDNARVVQASTYVDVHAKITRAWHFLTYLLLTTKMACFDLEMVSVRTTVMALSNQMLCWHTKIHPFFI